LWSDVVRLFVASLAETWDIAREKVDDLRRAITEICSNAPGRDDGTILVEVRRLSGRVQIRCEGIAPLSRGDEPTDPDVLRTRVLEALIPDATWIRIDEQPATVLFDVAAG